jgi:hypothetical protein
MEKCICGHPEDHHDPWCDWMFCGCDEYFPDEHYRPVSTRPNPSCSCGHPKFYHMSLFHGECIIPGCRCKSYTILTES